MTAHEFISYCLTKTGAYEDCPFGPDVTVIKTEGKIFAQHCNRSGTDFVTLNCERIDGEMLRGMYPGIIVRGYHCPAAQQPYFNTFPLNGSIPDGLIIKMIDASYKRVVGKMPKYIQRKLDFIK